MIKLCSFSPYWIRKRDWSRRAEMLYTVPILTIPPPWQSHWESFCRFFISSSEGSVGVGVGGGERVLFIFLSQWGEAVYFTLQWCVSNHNKQVHLGSGIKSDKRTKMLKAGPQGEGPTVGLPCMSACCGHRCGTGGLSGTGWQWRVTGASFQPCHSRLMQPWAHQPSPSVPQLPSLCNMRNEVCPEILKWKALQWGLSVVSTLSALKDYLVLIHCSMPEQREIKRDPCSHTELSRGHFTST